MPLTYDFAGVCVIVIHYPEKLSEVKTNCKCFFYWNSSKKKKISITNFTLLGSLQLRGKYRAFFGRAIPCRAFIIAGDFKRQINGNFPCKKMLGKCDCVSRNASILNGQ